MTRKLRTTKPNHPLLIVEDSDEDFVATERALRKAKLANPIVRCHDGEEALRYLLKNMDEENEATPSLVLLDLNLPGTDGREVLQEIKSHEQLKVIPVVVLTTSADERDIEECYRAGANSYIQKPVNLEGLFESIQRLKDYWFEVVILPIE